MIRGVPSSATADLDLAYGLSDMNGKDIRPFLVLKPKVVQLQDKTVGFRPASYAGEEAFTHPWAAYFNKKGVIFKPGVRSEAEFTVFESGYTVDNIILATDGRVGKFIDLYGGIGDMTAGVLKLAPTVKSSNPSFTRLALRGVRFELAYGMRWDEDTVSFVARGIRKYGFSQDDFNNEALIEIAAKVASVDAPPEKIRSALARLGLDEFIKKAASYGTGIPSYEKLRAGALRIL